jgi:2-oxoacid:acceptor oxidoreductase delta subunit (pyruvate/2-ketoisovalerate family)
MIQKCKGEVIKKSKQSLPQKERSKGFSKKVALKEARRCLSLRECGSCDVCSLLCPDLCITRSEDTGEVLIDLDYCKGCGICASVCPKGAIQMLLEDGI